MRWQFVQDSDFKVTSYPQAAQVARVKQVMVKQREDRGVGGGREGSDANYWHFISNFSYIHRMSIILVKKGIGRRKAS